EAFCLFDKEGDGQILSKELGTVLRACGFSPTEEQINNLLLPNEPQNEGENESQQIDLKLDVEGTGKINFEDFLKACRIMPKPSDEREELMGAFKVFDKHCTGKLLVEDFRQIMTTMGEKLNDSEFDELIKLVQIDGNGEFDYK
ncbi:MAG: hypothetical protein MHPSP_003725, partial [Paramarteilia canceri]